MRTSPVGRGHNRIKYPRDGPETDMSHTVECCATTVVRSAGPTRSHIPGWLRKAFPWGC